MVARRVLGGVVAVLAACGDLDPVAPPVPVTPVPDVVDLVGAYRFRNDTTVAVGSASYPKQEVTLNIRADSTYTTASSSWSGTPPILHQVSSTSSGVWTMDGDSLKTTAVPSGSTSRYGVVRGAQTSAHRWIAAGVMMGGRLVGRLP